MSFLTYLAHLLNIWSSVFVAPLKNTEMLWVIIPVYLNWIFTEIYQEKKVTSLGNAISNGTVVLWAGIDWVRYLIRGLSAGTIIFSADILIKFIIAFLVLSYGIFIITTGIRLKKITKYIGRIREVSYVLLMFTPILYNVINLTWENILTILLFFPIFYFVIEIIDRITPTPKTYEEEEKEEKLGKEKEILGAPSMGSELGGAANKNAGKQQKTNAETDLDKEMRKLGI